MTLRMSRGTKTDKRGRTRRSKKDTYRHFGALLAGLLILAISATVTHAVEEVAADDGSGDEGGIPEGVNCADGLIVPIWKPYENLSGGDRFGRGLLYILLMVYLFIGVAIVSDRSATNPHISHGTSRSKFFISTTLY